MRLGRTATVAVISVASAGLASCNGIIGDEGGAPGHTNRPGAAGGFVDSAMPTLHRLTVAEYQNTVASCEGPLCPRDASSVSH